MMKKAILTLSLLFIIIVGANAKGTPVEIKSEIKAYIFADENTCWTCIEGVKRLREIKLHNSTLKLSVFACSNNKQAAEIIKRGFNEDIEVIPDPLSLYPKEFKLANLPAIVIFDKKGEVEMKEKKMRVEDALSATRAAVEEGIVPGGGVAYLRAMKELEGLKGQNDDQNIGIQIIRKAIEEPIRQIVTNAGLEASVIVNKIKEGEGAYGFNAYAETYEDLFEAGVIDPTKVSRVALENASSVSGLLLTTEVTIVDKPQKETPMPPMPGGMPGMGGMDY